MELIKGSENSNAFLKAMLQERTKIDQFLKKIEEKDKLIQMIENTKLQNIVALRVI
jgi:hypothetical protein